MKHRIVYFLGYICVGIGISLNTILLNPASFALLHHRNGYEFSDIGIVLEILVFVRVSGLILALGGVLAIVAKWRHTKSFPLAFCRAISIALIGYVSFVWVAAWVKQTTTLNSIVSGGIAIGVGLFIGGIIAECRLRNETQVPG